MLAWSVGPNLVMCSTTLLQERREKYQVKTIVVPSTCGSFSSCCAKGRLCAHEAPMEDGCSPYRGITENAVEQCFSARGRGSCSVSSFTRLWCACPWLQRHPATFVSAYMRGLVRSLQNLFVRSGSQFSQRDASILRLNALFLGVPYMDHIPRDARKPYLARRSWSANYTFVQCRPNRHLHVECGGVHSEHRASNIRSLFIP